MFYCSSAWAITTEKNTARLQKVQILLLGLPPGEENLTTMTYSHILAPAYLRSKFNVLRVNIASSTPDTETSWMYRYSEHLPVSGHLYAEGRYFVYDSHSVPRYRFL